MRRAGAAALRDAFLGATLFGAMLFGATGCTVGPDYRRPETDPGAAFARAEASADVDAAAAVETAWWSRLGDPVLEDLIERAREANPDLRVAEANLRAARALLGGERRDRYPTVTARAAADRERQSEAVIRGVDPDLVELEQTFYSAGVDASWELDLFGRVRRAVEARSAEVEAAEADRRAAFVAVAGEVGRTYMQLCGARRRLQVARANVENQQESLDLVRELLDAGRGTELDVERARAQLESTHAQVPLLEAAEARAVHRLSVLVGKPPAALDSVLAGAGELPPLPERIAIGDPTALLRRRPDVAAAERRLAAATARIGVATAELYPRISLGGSFGALATSLDELGDAGSRSWSFGPFLQWAAFDLGRVRDRIDVREAETDAALARFEKTVLTALEETENALVDLDRLRRRQAALRRAERAAERAAELARERYRAGLDSFLAVLDAEARRLTTQDARASGAAETGAAVVALYVALGGSW